MGDVYGPHPDAVLCLCGDDELGHAPGADWCVEAPLKTRRPRPFRAGPTNPTEIARGACPQCGRDGVKVTGEHRRGAAFGLTAKAEHCVPLGVDLVLSPHKGPGRGAAACLFTGPPAQTRFTRSVEIASWELEHGPGSVQ